MSKEERKPPGRMIPTRMSISWSAPLTFPSSARRKTGARSPCSSTATLPCKNDTAGACRSQRRKTMSMNFNRLSTDDKILIMEGAQVLGDVVAGEGTAFWYNSVCRGEMQSVRIGKRCNIQDLALIHNKGHHRRRCVRRPLRHRPRRDHGDRVIVGMGRDGARRCCHRQRLHHRRGRSCHGQDERARTAR